MYDTSAAECQQVGATLAYYSSPKASATAVCIQDVDYGAWPRHFHRRRPQHVNSCTAVCRWLLCHSVPVAQYQAVHSTDCVSDSGCCPRAVTVGLGQSLLNAAAWSIADLRRSDHTTDTFTGYEYPSESSSSWQSWCTEVYMPLYMSDSLQHTANMPTRGRLRSSTSGDLDVHPSRLVNVGDRCSTTAAQSLCNSLPSDV